MAALLSCECVEGLAPFDKLTQIYAAAFALAGDDTLPSVECVAGLPPSDQLDAIYCALYSAAT